MQEIVGRQKVLKQAVQSVSSTNGVLFVGAAGLGKSVLAEAVGEALTSQGAHVERVRCSATTTQVPFAPLLHLLPRATSPNPTQLTLSLIEILTTRAGSQPLVLVIDDLQHSDPGTATVMFSLLTQENAKIIASTRPGDTNTPSVQSLWKDGHLDRIDLARLDNASISMVAEQLVGGSLTTALRTELTKRAAGNPFYAVSLTSAGLRSGAIQESGQAWDLAQPLPASREIADLIESQLRSLDPQARDLLDLVAIGENMPREILDAAAHQVLIPRLVADRLLFVDVESPSHSVRCAHPLIAEHIRRQLSDEQLRDVEHGLIERIARLDDATPADLLRAATMAMKTDTAVDAPMLEAAARIALTMIEYDLALQIALRASVTQPSAENHLLAGTALSMMGEVELAHHHFSTAEHHAPTEEQMARIAIARSNMAVFFEQDPARGEQLLRQTYERVDSPELRLRLGAMMIFPMAMSARNAEAIELGAELARIDSDDPQLELVVLGMYSMVKFMVGSFDGLDQIVGRARQAMHNATDPMFVGQINMADMAWRKSQCDLAGSSELVRSLSDLYVLDRRSGGQGAAWSSSLTMMQSLTGEVDDALVHTAVALEESTITDDPMGMAPMLEAARAVALAQSGASEQADDVFEILTADYVSQHRRAALWRAWADAWIIGADDPSAGAHLAADRGTWGLMNGMNFWSWDVLHTAVRLGHGDLVAETLALEAASSPNALIDLYARHAASAVAGDADLLVDVANDFASMGAWACAVETWAMVAAATDEIDGQQARANFCGSLAMRHCPSVQTPLAKRLVNPLTENETAVALLATQGIASKEIAATRFVSARTVDNQLRSIYKKLNIRGRTALTDLAGMAPKLDPGSKG